MTEFSRGSIDQEFEAYAHWREGLQATVNGLRDWLRDQDLIEAQTEQQLNDLLATLQDNRLYVAFVAEYSRGKSELINAIFFAGLGQRVLPSSAGRTTMCPNELLYDPQLEPCLRLLPIETRKSGTSLTEYKNFPDEWTSEPLDPDDADKTIEVLKRLSEIKRVSPEEARGLGLHISHDEGHEDGMHVDEDGMVEVPAYRHAIINYPSPLLKQGLVILDTPGLNALGAEPELTLSLLASAHAVLFVLAADTGVTKSDMAVWRDHISGGGSAPKGALVALNKIDVLWDELRDRIDVENEITRQVESTAKTLSIPKDHIFPVSAQKALLGKIRQNEDMLEQSRIQKLENAMAEVLIPAKREIVREHVRRDLDEITRNMRMAIMQRVRGVHDHIAELEGLNDKNVEVIEDMMDKVKLDKEHLEKSLQRFHATRSIFSQQTNLLYTHLNLRNLDSLIAETKKDMSMSLTTGGLRAAMVKFFERANKSMNEAATQAAEIKALMEGVYKKFQEEHGLANVKPGAFSTTRYNRELRTIETQHEQYLSGLSLVMTEQMAVVRRFYGSAVSKVRRVFEKANRDADNWLKTIMSPMESQVREHQVQLRRRLESIKRIHKASDTLEDRVGELRHVEQGFRDQEKKMEELLETIGNKLNSDEPAGDIAIEESA